MDNYYGQSMSPVDFKDGTAQSQGQNDIVMGNVDMSQMREGSNYSGTHHQQAISDATSSAAGGNGGSRPDSASAPPDQSANMNHHQQQNLSRFPMMMPNNDLNAFQFNPQAAMGQNLMANFSQGLQVPQFQPESSQQQQHQPQQDQQQQQQQQNNLMSQMMFQNAYANMLQNQSIAMRMNPNFMAQFSGNLSDPSFLAMIKNNMASLNLQNQMMSNMAMGPMLQQMQQNSGQRSTADQQGPVAMSSSDGQNHNMPQRNDTSHRPSPINTMELSSASPAHYSQQNSPVANSPRHASSSASLQRQSSNSQSRANGVMHNPQQEQIAQQLFMQQPGAENMPNPAFGVGQGDVSNLDLGNANPFPSAVRLNQNSYKDAYSSTGFDMVTVLMRVATRPNPTISIGAVDLSCAFVVCDVTQHDIPIIYCSDNFERLTGYTKHEILGRNCRFLQAPSGHVSAGVKRKYVDDETVLHLKNTIVSRKEAQVSVINYRKGGQPFMNLLTMIPVPYEGSEDTQFYVGFQVDLVEQPHSVTSRNSDGTYTVNYQRGLTMPRYVFAEKDQPAPLQNSGQTISRDEVSTVLATVGSGDSELSKRIWDKVLLENTDDVVFVLSLKGLFLYLSPSSTKVLEYDPAELNSTALSSVCHPSDIVPVTRELKDTANGATVSVVFRIRRKINGYMWFEGHGSLYTEQGKGRKSIVLVGRERPVYTVKQPDIAASGGIGENEVWTKLSTSGMFLFVSSSVRSLIDKQPHELVGTSMQSLMRPDSRAEFGRILEVARSGRRAQTRHELLNRRGQVLQAFSTLYPGDASEGTKPTFFVAQTRLLKYTRPGTTNSVPPRSPVAQTPPVDRTNAHRGSVEPNRGKPSTARSSPSVGSGQTPNHYMSTFETISTHAGQDSLPLGNQGEALAHELNMFDELKTTRSTSWQFELRQMERHNRLLAEELQRLLAARKKRKRRKGAGVLEKECANCHTKQTPEWRRGPSGNRDLCNSCGLRWAKQQGRISPRTSGHRSNKSANSAKSAKSAKSSGSPAHHSGQAGSFERPHSGSTESGMVETRNIDETLARSGQHSGARSLSGEVSAHTSNNQSASPIPDDPMGTSKATKVEDTDGRIASPVGASGMAVPTKVENNE